MMRGGPNSRYGGPQAAQSLAQSDSESSDSDSDQERQQIALRQKKRHLAQKQQQADSDSSSSDSDSDWNGKMEAMFKIYLFKNFCFKYMLKKQIYFYYA